MNQTGTGLRASGSACCLMFEGSQLYADLMARSSYDIFPDGQRFLMIKQAEAQTQINLVLNWFEELKRLVPTE